MRIVVHRMPTCLAPRTKALLRRFHGVLAREEPAFERITYDIGPAPQIQFFAHARLVSLDRLAADRQAMGDLLDGMPAGQHEKYLLFASTEQLGAFDRVAQEQIYVFVTEVGIDKSAAVSDGANCGEKFPGRAAEQDISQRPGAQH